MVLLAGGKCWISGHQPGKGGTWVKGMKESLWGHPLCASTGLGAGHRCLGKSPVLQRQSSSSSWYRSLRPTAFHLGTSAVWGGFEVCKMGPCSGQLRQWPCWGGRPRGQAGTLLVSGGASSAPWVLEAAGGCRGDPCFLLRPDQRNLSSNAAREALFTLPRSPRASPSTPGTVLRSGERSPHIPHHLKPPPPLPSMSLCTGTRALFLFPPSQHSHVLTKRSGPCHRPLPPRTPSETLHHPSRPPGPRGCREGTLPPSFGDPSIRRISPFFAFIRLVPGPPPQGCAARSTSRHPRPPDLGCPPLLLRAPIGGARPSPPRPFPDQFAARGPRGAPPPAHPALLCAPGARCVKAGAPRPHAHTHRRTISPRERQEGRWEGWGPPPPSPIARSLPGRAAPPPPLLRADRGRGGSERVGAQTCRNRARVSAGGRGTRAGAGPFPPGAGSRAAGLPRREGRESPGAAAPGPGTHLDWPGRGGAPSPSFSSSGTIVYKDTASLPTPGRDHRVLTIPPGRRGGAGKWGTAGGSCSR